jgi:hypothetical protein
MTDEAIFCPSCGWQEYSDPAQGTHIRAADEFPPAPPTDPYPGGVWMVRKVLAYAVVPVSIVLWLVAGTEADAYLEHWIPFIVIGPGVVWLLFTAIGLVVAIIAVSISAWLYPPAGDRYERLWSALDSLRLR